MGIDPRADAEEVRQYQGRFTLAQGIGDLAAEAEALVLVTEWPEFRELDFAALARQMKTPLLIDSKNFLDPRKLTAAGFDYQGFGRSVAPGQHQESTG